MPQSTVDRHGQGTALGLKAMRDSAFLTIAQDRATSAVYGMPKAAAELGAAMEITPSAALSPESLVGTLRAQAGA